MEKELTSYTKEVISAGNYVYGDEEFVVDMEFLQGLVSGTRAAGLRPYVPIDHDSTPENNKGWVSDMWVDGESLYARLDILDPDTDEKIRMGMLGDVSAAIVYEYEDNKGNTHPAVIREISVTNTPFITGLDGYEMNDDNKNNKEVKLSIVNKKTNKEEKKMDLTAKVKELFKIDTDSRVKELSDTNKELTETNESLLTKLSEVKEELTTLKTATDEVNADKAVTEWNDTWEVAVKEFKVKPAKKDEYKTDFPEVDSLVKVLSKLEPQTDLSNDDTVEPVVDETIIEGLSPELVNYLKETGLTEDEINKFK